MSILSRFKAIFQARADAVADQMEDPKASLDFSLRKLEENRRQLARSLVEVSAAKRRLENQRDKLAAAAAKHEEQARASVQAGRDDMARIVLERKQMAEARQAEVESNILKLEQQVNTLKQSQSNLDRKIELFRSQKEELKAIYDSSRAQLRVQEAVSGVSDDLADVGNTIQRAEERIDEMQSRADAIDSLVAEGVLDDVLDPGVDEIDRELARLGRSQSVEAELERMKAQVTPATDKSASEPFAGRRVST